ncbi:MAG: ABC transporter permease [Actinomycetota bacterium]|nr:ABC transporter permease [Actinomycetota bacterium]
MTEDTPPRPVPSTSSEAELTATDAALAGGVKPRRLGSLYVLEHRLLAMRAYLQTILTTSVGNPLVYLFALGVGLATLVEQEVPAGGGNTVGYLTFVAPALLATAAVMVATEESTYPFVAVFKWNPIAYAMNAAPISGVQIANGMIFAIVVRILPTVAIYYVIMLLFGAVPLTTGVVDILTATLTGVAVGVLISAYTSRIQDDKGQMAMIMRFGVTPMFLFSGTFFPLTQLPVFLQWIGWISPLWHGTELGRVFSYGMEEPIWLTGVRVLYLVAITVVCWRMTQRVVTRRLNK